jgi:hypothetical protein
MLTALNYWRNNGIVVGGQTHKITAFAEVDPTNLLEVRQSIWMFGNVFTGVALPTSAQQEDAWTVPVDGIYGVAGQPGGWGGHCIPCCAESPETLTCVTWGDRLKMSHNFFDDYCDELYAVLSPDWDAPLGLNMKELEADLASL